MPAMSNRSSILRLALLVVGSILLSLSIVNVFVRVPGFPMAYVQMVLVFALAGAGMFYGREWLKVRAARITVKAIVYTPLLAFLFGVVLLFIPVQPLGRLAAQRDISSGIYIVHIPLRPWRDELTKVLKDQYDVTAKLSGGCFTTTFQSTYNSGYQSVVLKALKDKYGRDIIKECTEKVESESLLSKINGTWTRGVDFMRLGGPQRGILEDLPPVIF